MYVYIDAYIYIYNIYIYIYTPLENKNKIETDSLTSHDQLHKLRLNLINKILLLIKTENHKMINTIFNSPFMVN